MVNKFLYPNGGSETYIFQLGKELAKMGGSTKTYALEYSSSNTLPCTKSVINILLSFAAIAARYADEVIVLSRNVQDYFKDVYHRETHYIPNGVNRPEKKEVRAGHGAFLILYIQ